MGFCAMPFNHAAMDPLRHVFSLLKLEASPPVRLYTGGTWALSYPASSHVRFGAAIAGSCWLSVAGVDPIELQPGDGWLITRCQPYTMSSHPGLQPMDGLALHRKSPDSRVVHVGERRDTILVGGRFPFYELNSEMLLSVLPPVLHLRADSASSRVVRAAVEILDHETIDHPLGSGVITHHVAQIMLIHALRAAAAAPDPPPLGWLAGLADPRIAKALQLIHEETAQPWTVEQLAQHAGLSRSLFALRFKNLVGLPPLEYLRHFRIRSAAQVLRSSTRNVSTIAFEMGYESESAFTTAFKRVMGVAPREYRTVAPHGSVTSGRVHLATASRATGVSVGRARDSGVE